MHGLPCEKSGAVSIRLHQAESFGRVTSRKIGDRRGPCLVGVASDVFSVTGSGSRDGPDAIRIASRPLADFFFKSTITPPHLVNYSTGRTCPIPLGMSDLGNLVPEIGANAHLILRDVEKLTGAICAAGRTPIVLGGDHSITYGAVKGLGRDQMTIVTFDAHLDNAESEVRGTVDNASVIRALLTEGIAAKVVTVGMRSLSTRIGPAFERRHQVIPASQFVPSAFKPAFSGIPSSAPCWLSIDLDVFDPGAAPGTNTPVPGGLNFDTMVSSLEYLVRTKNVLGADIVELNPMRDRDFATATLAAHLTLILASNLTASNRKPTRP